MERLINRRQQGDLGEASAIEWLTNEGAIVFAPIGHSPDIDLIAVKGGKALRIEAKTTSCRAGERWQVGIATLGGNRSGSGRVKRFEQDRCDFLFVLAADGRRWLIPTTALDCKTALTLGGPKYSEFEIESGTPFEVREEQSP